jgi:hypothetical protein
MRQIPILSTALRCLACCTLPLTLFQMPPPNDSTKFDLAWIIIWYEVQEKRRGARVTPKHVKKNHDSFVCSM